MKQLNVVLLITLMVVKINGQSNNFSAKFDELHSTLAITYAFTEWKGINWDELYAEFQPRIASAEALNDSSAYYLALRDYLYRIPDGHVSLITAVTRETGWGIIKQNLMYDQIGGSYGFLLIGLDDGRVVVRNVVEGSSADSAGIKFGAEIIEVNKLPIIEALNKVSCLWSESIPATNEGRILQQYRFIGRAPVGSSMEVIYKNRNENDIKTATLFAVDDNYLTYNLSTLSTSRDDKPFVSSRRIEPEGFGYIQITSCGTEETAIEIFKEFKNVLQVFVDDNVPGIILDLRINEGGEDYLASALAGFFYSDTTFYESVTAYNPLSGNFETLPVEANHINGTSDNYYVNPGYQPGTIYIEAHDLHYGGPLVLLGGPRQISSGEGISMALQKLPNCEVVSLYGSHGSFGIVVPDFAVWLEPDMSNPLLVMYPFGRSLDENNNIQVDSDAGMNGGVIPDIRPPLDDSAIDKIYLQNIDYELEFAVDHLKSPVDIEEDKRSLPEDYVMHQNYPNPFNPATKINYTIPNVVNEPGMSRTSAANVSLIVYDILGRVVSVLVNEVQGPGNHEIEFDAGRLSSGVYFYSINVGKFNAIRKMVLLR